MAVQFFNGNGHKNNAPIPPELMRKAAEAAKTYDWTSDPTEVAKIEGSDVKSSSNEGEEYPKKFACRKTGIVATKMQEGSPVLFVKGDLLLLTADDQTVRDIIT